VVLFCVVLLAVVLIVRALTTCNRWTARAVHTMPAPPRGAAAGSAEQVLADRLARGDIDIDDYHRRLAALHEGTVPPPPTGPPPGV
jgi:putative membrane protein